MNDKSSSKIARERISRLKVPQFITCGPVVAMLLCAAILHPSGARALGFRIPNQDAGAIARGNAFTATADNPSAIYYNPAGITQLEGENAQFGLHALSINSFYDSTSGQRNAVSDFSIATVPQFFATCSPTNMPFSFGLGVYAPYGLSLDWPSDSSFRTNGEPFHGRLIYLTVNPVVAWRVTDKLSLAVGPTINYSQVVLRQGAPAPLTQFNYRGEGYAFGFTAGAMWHPVEEWSFGASYHSPTTMDFHGHTAFDIGSNPSTARAPFPQFIMGGVSYRPNTNWNFEVDADWTDWHALKTVTFQNAPFVGNIPFVFDWKSSWLAEIGGTRYLQNGYFVSAGYFFSESSTTDANFSPIVPDTDLHVGSVGFGHKGKRFDWTFAGQIITGPPRDVTSQNNPTANGSYQWINGSLDFSVNYHF